MIMQHKARYSRLKTMVLLATIVVVGGLAALMMTDIPAPGRTIEKQIDVKDFLEPKQP